MLTVTTYNLQNLFAVGADSGPTSEPAYEAKLTALADSIARVDPDVLALQEVGDPEVLSDLLTRVKALQSSSAEWHVRLSVYPDGRGIRVAFGCRRVHVDNTFHINDLPAGVGPVRAADDDAVTSSAAAVTADMGRGALGVSVMTPSGVQVHLISAHLKSKLLTFPGGRFAPRSEDERARYAAFALYRRAAEAASLRIAVDGLLERHADGGREIMLVLLGDFNDTPDAATTQLLQGPPGSEIGTRGERRPDQGDRMRLWNLAPLLPESQRYSRIHRGDGELIDHIFVTHALLDDVVKVRAGTAISDVAEAELVGPRLVSINEDPNDLRNHAGSDHAPITAWLQV